MHHSSMFWEITNKIYLLKIYLFRSKGPSYSIWRTFL